MATDGGRSAVADEGGSADVDGYNVAAANGGAFAAAAAATACVFDDIDEPSKEYIQGLRHMLSNLGNTSTTAINFNNSDSKPQLRCHPASETMKPSYTPGACNTNIICAPVVCCNRASRPDQPKSPFVGATEALTPGR
uniref:Uncharacterized protein n=1 Tax=Arundo donax TaxID=35708 RepID=A0A0A9GGN0_ARUDO